MTDGVTNLIDSLNPSVLESLNGALGVEFYVPKTKELDDFAMRWNMRFQIDNPTDPPLKLNIFGLWGYDTIWAVAHAAAKVGLANATFQKPGATRNSISLETLETSSNGPKLLQAIICQLQGIIYPYWSCFNFFPFDSIDNLFLLTGTLTLTVETF